MTENITNIINYEKLTGIGNSAKTHFWLEPGSIVSIELIEQLEKGVKVLINGKLFIAIIDEPIPLKEEILALVTNVKKLSLSLNFENQLYKNKKKLLEEIFIKLKIAPDNILFEILENIIKEKKPLIKTKIIQLFELIGQLNLESNSIQILLLIHLVWNNLANNNYAKDLITNLFQEPFEYVCEQVAETTKQILFTGIPQYIAKEITDKLIYNEDYNNTIALGNKTESIIKIIKTLSNYSETRNEIKNKKEINSFIEYGSKYVLQKIVLQQYDYYPDLILVKHNNDIAEINVEIKKHSTPNGTPTYKIKLQYKKEPLELKGLLKDYLLIGNISANINNSKEINEQIKNTEERLLRKIKIKTNITINNEVQNQNMQHLNYLVINKLVS